MSVKSEVYNALIADTSLTSYVGSNIYHMILPLNFDVSTHSLVYSSRAIEPVFTFAEKDIGVDYNVTIKIVGTSTVNMELINTNVRRTMHAIDSSNVQDVMFERSNEIYDDTNELFTDSLDFTINYCY
jgi:hypothetical protein